MILFSLILIWRIIGKTIKQLDFCKEKPKSQNSENDSLLMTDWFRNRRTKWRNPSWFDNQRRNTDQLLSTPAGNHRFKETLLLSGCNETPSLMLMTNWRGGRRGVLMLKWIHHFKVPENTQQSFSWNISLRCLFDCDSSLQEATSENNITSIECVDRVGWDSDRPAPESMSFIDGNNLLQRSCL